MLSRLFRQFLASCGVVFRTIRAFFSRQFYSVLARIKSVTSLTRQASKLAPAMLKTATAASRKPSRREDYIETQQMFISKSFLLFLLVGLCALILLITFVVWPFLMRHFFTARYWMEDPAVSDYTGRVILYYDQEKKSRYLEGHLEEGVLQGKGVCWDEHGLTVYEGNYVDGVYSGEGTLYQEGELLYKGMFAGGLYEGEGQLYSTDEILVYEGSFAGGLFEGQGLRCRLNGVPLYEGEFSKGVYEGQGQLYNLYGKLAYSGAFSDGHRNGMGTAYRSGVRFYRGGFEDDLYSGEGFLYDETGQLLYRGSFSEGLYNGDGTLSLGNGITLQATFEAGEVMGAGKCFLNRKLYYEGDIANYLPDGIGTVYNGNGSAVYEGPVKYGCVDGGALLNCTAQELRDILQGQTEDVVYNNGFAIRSTAMGLTAYCSYAEEGAEASVHDVYFYGPGKDQLPQALLWPDAVSFETAASPEEPLSSGAATPDFPVELPIAAPSYCHPYQYESYRLRLWQPKTSGGLTLAEWRADMALPDRVPEEASEEDSRLAALMEKLGLTVGTLGTESGAAAAASNPYCGDLAASALLAAASAEELPTVSEAALSYLETAEARAVDEANLTLYHDLLTEETALVDVGKGDPDRVTELEETVSELEIQIQQHAVQMRKDSRTVKDLTGCDVAEFDLEGLLTVFDVSALDTDALGEAMIAEAKRQAQEEADAKTEAARQAAEEAAAAAASDEDTASGEDAAADDSTASGEDAAADDGTATDEGTASGDGAASGEDTASDDDAATGEDATPDGDAAAKPAAEIVIDPEPVDQKKLMQDLEDSVLDLELAGQNVQLAQQSYETALSGAEKAEQAYNLGTGTKNASVEAQAAVNTKRAALYAAMTAFTRQAMALDTLSGGWLTSSGLMG